jgi:type IV secretory pathway VirB2 component (pilin)
MRKTLAFTLFFALLCLPVLAFAGSVHAVDVLDPVCQNNNDPLVCQENAAGSGENPIFGPEGILTRIISILARVIGVVAVIAIIIYGFKMASAGGDPAAAKTARSGVAYAVIGLVIALTAQGIVTFVLNRL